MKDIHRAALVGLAVIGIGLASIAPAASGPNHAASSAGGTAAGDAATAPTVVARIPLHATEFDMADGLGAVWLIDLVEDNYSTLRRIDPATNQVTSSMLLDSSAGGITVGAGSIWVPMNYDNTVERLDPHGRVIARIPVGLQPQEPFFAYGSVWVSNHHSASVSRIDPRTDRVAATIPAGDPARFRNGPQGFSQDGRYLYVYASNGDRPFERIDPRTNRVTTYPMTNDLCGLNTWLAGWVFIPYCDQPGILQIDPTTGAIVRVLQIPPNTSQTDVNHVAPASAVYRGDLWVGYATVQDPDTGAWSGGTLADYDPMSGALRRQVMIGGDISRMIVADGDLWVADNTNGMILRLHTR